MGNKAITWAFEQPLQPTHKIVLLVLADTANPKTNECWPSIRFIAERACISEDTVIRALKELAAGGYITKEHRYTEGGRQTTCLYRLTVSVEVHQGRNLQGGGSQIAGEEGRNCATPYEPKEGTLLSVPKGTASSDPTKAARGKRLEEEWTPSPASLVKAEELGYDEGLLKEEIEGFKNYWLSKPGKDGTKLDWERTFQNWLMNSKRRPHNGQRSAAAPGAQRSIPTGQPSTLKERFARIHDAIRREREALGLGEGGEGGRGDPSVLSAS